MPRATTASGPPRFAVTVDLVVLTVRDAVLHTLLIERGVEPYRGRLALPGGFVQVDETLIDAARRELSEETNLTNISGYMEQLGTYGDPGRDPRLRVVSVAYLALAPNLPLPHAGTDAASAMWVPINTALSHDNPLAFDHHQILLDGLDRARAKVEYTPVATAFCPSPFTIAELRQIYEAVWGTKLDARNFHRKVTSTPGFVEEVGATTTRGGGRPAQLYRPGPARWLTPALTRQEAV